MESSVPDVKAQSDGAYFPITLNRCLHKIHGTTMTQTQ